MNKRLKDFGMMTSGAVLMSTGVYFFKIPNGFSTGGVSGIGTLLGKAAPVFTSSEWIMIINIALLAVGFFILGRNNVLRTVYCSMLFSAVNMIFEYVVPISEPLTNQPFLELCYAMILTAVGSALIFNSDASSGGTDIIALVLKKYTNLDVGKALLASDSLIAASSFFVFGVEAGLFSVIGLFAKAFLVDNIIESINSCKYFIVITNKADEIADYIIKYLHHGATVCRAQGMYTHDNKYMVHTVCKRIEAIHLRKYVRSVDPHSFVIITTTSEIVGRGFRSM